MRGDEFRIYDPFARQRKKRTGSASDFRILYEQDIDKPAIAKIVEAARRTKRGKDNFDEVGVEEWAERIDAQARADASNATYGDKPFAPRDFAAKRGIDLAELGRKKNKRHPLQWALHGTKERQYQQANDAFGQRDYEELMAIPERRKEPRRTDIENGFGQPPADITAGDLGVGRPVTELPGGWIKRPFPMPRIVPGEDVWRKIQPMPINDPPTDGGEQPPEGGNDVAPFPGRMRFPVQPVEDPGMEPIPGGPPYEHPEFGRGYPFPQPVTEPRQAVVEEPPEINPGFGQEERTLLIDQLIGAIATGQISIGAVKELVGTDQMNKLAVQGMNAFATTGEEAAFAGEGLNQFTAINTDPRATPAPAPLRCARTRRNPTARCSRTRPARRRTHATTSTKRSPVKKERLHISASTVRNGMNRRTNCRQTLRLLKYAIFLPSSLAEMKERSPRHTVGETTVGNWIFTLESISAQMTARP